MSLEPLPEFDEGDPAALRATPPSSPRLDGEAAGAHNTADLAGCRCADCQLGAAILNRNAKAAREAQLPIEAWLVERLRNCERIASTKSGADRDGWLEDADYFRTILAALLSVAPASERSEGTPDAPSGEAPDRDVIVKALREVPLTWICGDPTRHTHRQPPDAPDYPAMAERMVRLFAPYLAPRASSAVAATLDSAQRGAGSPRPAASDAGAADIARCGHPRSAITPAACEHEDEDCAWCRCELYEDMLARISRAYDPDIPEGTLIGMRGGKSLVTLVEEALAQWRAPAPRLGEATPAVRVDPEGGE